MVALSHALMDGNERIEWIKGDIEPLVGRERGEIHYQQGFFLLV